MGIRFYHMCPRFFNFAGYFPWEEGRLKLKKKPACKNLAGPQQTSPETENIFAEIEEDLDRLGNVSPETEKN